MEISLRRETKLVLGQRMYQSMNLLQMSTAELNSYLNELSMENPLLEEKPPVSSVEMHYMHSYSSSIKNKNNGDDLELPIPDKVKTVFAHFLKSSSILCALILNLKTQ